MWRQVSQLADSVVAQAASLWLPRQQAGCLLYEEESASWETCRHVRTTHGAIITASACSTSWRTRMSPSVFRAVTAVTTGTVLTFILPRARTQAARTAGAGSALAAWTSPWTTVDSSRQS